MLTANFSAVGLRGPTQATSRAKACSFHTPRVKTARPTPFLLLKYCFAVAAKTSCGVVFS